MSFAKQPDGSYIEAGKEVSVISGMVVDDTKDLYVPATGVPPVKCEDYTTESECTAAGCHWYDGACHKLPPGVVCSDYTSESTCTAAGCHWYDGACHSEPKVPPGVEIPWAIIAAAVGVSIVVAGVAIAIRR